MRIFGSGQQRWCEQRRASVKLQFIMSAELWKPLGVRICAMVWSRASEICMRSDRPIDHRSGVLSKVKHIHRVHFFCLVRAR